MTDLPDLLATDRIQCRCDIHSKKRALQTVAELLGASLRKEALEISDNDEPDVSHLADMAILDALISRERLGSTGIGHGIALPHCRLPGIKGAAAALITLQEGVDFEATDGEHVDVVIGLLVPEKCNDEHLKLLAKLAKRFSDADQRASVRHSESEEALLTHLKSSTYTD